MSRAPAPTAILHMPDSPDGAVLRAGLTSMRIPSEPRDRDTALRRLVEGTNSVLIIGISRAARPTSPTLLQFDSLLPRGECRKRVFLTRLIDGRVSPSDRQRAASLRFPHFYSEFDAGDCEETCPRCWIGAEAVTNLCARHGLTRHAAWVVLHRLMRLSLVEHVTHDRPFIDGTFFYRFAGLPPKGALS